MGDRAVVIFRSSDKSEVSPTVYLHWNGSNVPAYLKQLDELMKDRKGDVSYACARFIGICHEEIPGNLSLGVFQTDVDTYERRDYSHGDAGVIIVNCDDFSWTAFGGYLATHEDASV